MTNILETIKFDKEPDGLVPAVVQDATTRDVIMLGFMNAAALEATINTGRVTFWSRSRQQLWTKGDTSGNTLNLVAIRVNCNDDSLLVLANPMGPTCHTGHPTCYYREYDPSASAQDWVTISEPLFDPNEVYKH